MNDFLDHSAGVTAHETLGLLLVQEEKITRPQLYEALRLQKKNNALLGTCLLSMGYLTMEQLLDTLSKQLSIPALASGLLAHSAAEAIQRIPSEVAHRLRVMPYSWDGKMLGVAVADGRALSYMPEVAQHSQSAVGAYVAIAEEIDRALSRFYPVKAGSKSLTPEPVLLTGRPRPARAQSQIAEDPILLTKPRSAAQLAPVLSGPPKAVSNSPTPTPSKPELLEKVETMSTVLLAPPAKTSASSHSRPLKRQGLYDAVEKLYESQNAAEVAVQMGAAFLNYFSRVMVFTRDGFELITEGHTGLRRPAERITLKTEINEATQAILYGRAIEAPAAAALGAQINFGGAATVLMVVIGSGSQAVVVYGDNEGQTELYEELHDIEMVVKEAQTALAMLSTSPV